jgi:hypothetical protein
MWSNRFLWTGLSSGVAVAALTLGELWLAFFRVGHQRPDMDLRPYRRLGTSWPDRLSSVLVHGHISLSQLFTVPNDGAGWCNICCGHCCSCRIHDNRWHLCRPHDLRGGTVMEGCVISSLGDIRICAHGRDRRNHLDRALCDCCRADGAGSPLVAFENLCADRSRNARRGQH